MASCSVICAVVLITVVLCGILFGSGVYYGDAVLGDKSECRLMPIACNFSEWNEWSHCSQECGPDGTQFRVRNVIQANECGPVVCTEPSSQERPCNRVCYNGGSLSQAGCNCRGDYSGRCCECEHTGCKLTQWGVWSHCSQECGPDGTQFRVRNVFQSTGCGPVVCTDPTSEERPCNRVCYNGGSLTQTGCNCQPEYGGPCCQCQNVDCKFSQWNEWSHCSQECGPDGTQFRVRDVIQATGCGPVVCTETTSEDRPCNRVCYNGGSLSQAGCDCKVEYSGQCCGCKDIDCKISQWTKWSSCENATSRVRSRDILRVSECAGIECKGPYTEEQACSCLLYTSRCV
ncbi:A disintegrin and metalloproteinase with thrombospondin motifs adt-2-like [Anneissia japonica]|uniref:A disintegrin and metalloproteinase with thrombospondin motifs adt-2-like n=1 Tax=Anneissia japonica TaxID=1529436 RepID=UPI001425579E|nr:A disintegrin and metalloproteinase with thrombospondin motifs adt-2-like [Anneissia japonica]